MDVNLTGAIAANVSLIEPSASWPSDFFNSQLLGVIVGGLITGIVNYLLHNQQKKDEAIKRQEDYKREKEERHYEEQRELFKDRKKAYIRFQSALLDTSADKAYFDKMRSISGEMYLLGKINIALMIGGYLERFRAEILEKLDSIPNDEAISLTKKLFFELGQNVTPRMREEILGENAYEKLDPDDKKIIDQLFDDLGPVFKKFE